MAKVLKALYHADAKIPRLEDTATRFLNVTLDRGGWPAPLSVPVVFTLEGRGALHYGSADPGRQGLSVS
jgi:hypothetical protein